MRLAQLSEFARYLPYWRGAAGVVAIFAMGGVPLDAVADSKAGRDKAQLCLLCHKPSPNNRFVPLLEQQPADYLVLALTAYKSGRRTETSMSINAASLSAVDIEEISAYFAAKEFPARTQDLEASRVAEGRKLLSGMDCANCHAADFRGQGPTPGLAGQTYGYLVGQISVFRKGGRSHPSPMTLLKDEKDVERAASFLASLR